MLNHIDQIGAVALLRVTTSQISSADLPSFQRARNEMRQIGAAAMLVDLSGVKDISQSGIGALLEFTSTFDLREGIGFCCPSPKVLRKLNTSPASALIALYPSQEAALRTEKFRRHLLADIPTVILCAGRGTRMGPLSKTTPKPVLDFLGKPVLQHILEHLDRFGVRTIYLNPGYLAPRVHEKLNRTLFRNMFFLNEGFGDQSNWQAEPLGSATTLARLHQTHSAFDRDFIVICGDALIDVDLAAMMALHRKTGAEVTIAAQQVPLDDVHKYGILGVGNDNRITCFQEKPSPGAAVSNLASTGIYIFSPRTLAGLSVAPGQDIGNHLLPSLMKRHVHIQAYTASFNWIDLGNFRDYFAALQRGLAGGLPFLQIGDARGSRGHLIDRTSIVGPRVSIKGNCYISANAQIDDDVEIVGPVVIGANCNIRGPALLQNCLIAENTTIQPGAWIDGMMVGPDWAISLTSDERGAVTSFPLDQVQVQNATVTDGQPSSQRARLHS